MEITDVIIAILAMDPSHMPAAIPSCDMRVISNADIPIPAPASRYTHESVITAVSTVTTITRSRLTTSSSVASTETVILFSPDRVSRIWGMGRLGHFETGPFGDQAPSHAVSLDLSRTSPS